MIYLLAWGRKARSLLPIKAYELPRKLEQRFYLRNKNRHTSKSELMRRGRH
jgi:hypothetical protein